MALKAREGLNELDKGFVEMYQKAGRAYGMDSLVTKMYGILYLEPEEVSLEDLAKKTGYSLASVSNKVKVLERAGLASRVKKPGSKKVFFFMEKDLMKLIKGSMLSNEQNMVKLYKESLPGIIENYEQKAKTEDEKKKLKIIKDFHRQIIKLEEMMRIMREKIDKMCC